MCKFLRQLKLCSITNRWEPFTRRAGASISLERQHTQTGTPLQAPTHPLCSGSCTPTRGRLTPPGEEIPAQRQAGKAPQTSSQGGSHAAAQHRGGPGGASAPYSCPDAITQAPSVPKTSLSTSTVEIR